MNKHGLVLKKINNHLFDAFFTAKKAFTGFEERYWVRFSNWNGSLHVVSSGSPVTREIMEAIVKEMKL